MYKKKTDPRYIVLIILCLIAVLLIYFSYILNTDRKLNIFEQMIKDTVITTENIIASPFELIGDKFNEMFEYNNVYNENKILKEKLKKYDVLKVENDNLKAELNELENLTKIDYSLSSYTLLNATVNSRNPLYWYNTITVNKGSNNGVKKDMAVVSSKGLIGKISKTTKFTSTVTLITSLKLSVAINANNKIINGVISNYDYENDLLIVEGISDYMDIPKDSYVYTTGFNKEMPSGILIGKVKEIIADEYELSKVIKIKLSADLDNINYVSILKRDDT